MGDDPKSLKPIRTNTNQVHKIAVTKFLHLIGHTACLVVSFLFFAHVCCTHAPSSFKFNSAISIAFANVLAPIRLPTAGSERKETSARPPRQSRRPRPPRVRWRHSKAEVSEGEEASQSSLKPLIRRWGDCSLQDSQLHRMFSENMVVCYCKMHRSETMLLHYNDTTPSRFQRSRNSEYFSIALGIETGT